MLEIDNAQHCSSSSPIITKYLVEGTSVQCISLLTSEYVLAASLNPSKMVFNFLTVSLLLVAADVVVYALG